MIVIYFKAYFWKLKIGDCHIQVLVIQKNHFEICQTAWIMRKVRRKMTFFSISDCQRFFCIFFDFSKAHNFFPSLLWKLKIRRFNIQVLVIQKNQTWDLLDCLKYEKSEWKNDLFFNFWLSEIFCMGNFFDFWKARIFFPSLL